MFMSFAGLYVHHVYVWCLWRSEEDIDPEARVTNGCETGVRL